LPAERLRADCATDCLRELAAWRFAATLPMVGCREDANFSAVLR